jgi:hypothetical protein
MKMIAANPAVVTLIITMRYNYLAQQQGDQQRLATSAARLTALGVRR